MAYSSKAVANYLLDLGRENNVRISPMKLQKLIYYAHGWHLGFTGEPLIDEQVECWQYGPVVDSLFHEFKEFGSGAITRRAKSQRHERLGDSGRLRFWWIAPELPPDATQARNTIDVVWNSYGQFSAYRLSNMTHREGTPWKMVYDSYNGKPPKGTDIPTEVILEHFRTLAEGNGNER